MRHLAFQRDGQTEDGQEVRDRAEQWETKVSGVLARELDGIASAHAEEMYVTALEVTAG